MDYKLAKLYDAEGDLSKQWFVFFYFNHPEKNKLVRFRKWISLRLMTAAARRKKAESLITSINSRLRKGWNPFSEEDISLKSVAQALTIVLSLMKVTVGYRSFLTYKSIAGIFLRYLEKNNLDNIPVNEINTQIIQGFFDYSILNEKINARTYNNRITALKTIFNLLIKRSYLDFNPLTRIDRLREDEVSITAFTKKDLEIVTEHLPGYHYGLYAITQLIFYCFLRPAEIVRLQYKDIDWDAKRILVPGSKSKNKKSETINIPEKMITNLRDWDLNYNPEWYIFSRNLNPGTKEIAPTRIAEHWKKFAVKYKIKKNIYSLKHTGNGMAVDMGLNIRDIQLQNRHYSLEQTQKYLNRFRKVPSERFIKDFGGF